MLQASADYGKMVAEMEKTDHAFDVNAPGERPYSTCKVLEFGCGIFGVCVLKPSKVEYWLIKCWTSFN